MLDEIVLIFLDLDGTEVCRSLQELSKEYLVANIDVDTAKNEPLKVPLYM